MTVDNKHSGKKKAPALTGASSGFFHPNRPARAGQPISNTMHLATFPRSYNNKFRRNIALQAVLGELAAVGIRPEIYQGKHLKLRWVSGGRAFTTILPVTSSDWRASRNATAFVRRQLDGRRL
jgi:hypothetical protein